MSTPVPRRRSRNWLFFFAVLTALSVVALVAPLIYNLSIQLQPRQLIDARHRWEERAAANYDLECLRQVRRGGQEEKSQYLARVRGGRIVAVVEDGELIYADPSLAVIVGSSAAGLSQLDPTPYDMPALFAEIDSVLRQSAAAERRFYLKADFEKDGHPSHFVSYDPRTKSRVEWFIKLSFDP